MSDDKIVEFTKISQENKSNKAGTIEERVVNCMSNGDNCNCMYCNYRKQAAQMVVDFLAGDIVTFEKNQGARFCTFDLKDILFKAIYIIKEHEKEGNGEEDNK